MIRGGKEIDQLCSMSGVHSDEMKYLWGGLGDGYGICRSVYYYVVVDGRGFNGHDQFDDVKNVRNEKIEFIIQILLLLCTLRPDKLLLTGSVCERHRSDPEPSNSFSKPYFPARRLGPAYVLRWLLLLLHVRVRLTTVGEKPILRRFVAKRRCR